MSHKTLAMLACTALVGCSADSPPVSSPVTPQDPVVITTSASGGSNQRGRVGEGLPSPLAVRVLAGGIPAEGMMVHWSSYWGDVHPDSSLTNENGIAFTTWTASNRAGSGEATASIRVGNPPRAVALVHFVATSDPGPAVSITAKSGGSQSLPANSTRSFFPLRLGATDRFGNSATEGTVTWTVVQGPVEVYSWAAPGDGATVTGGMTVNVRKLGIPGAANVRAVLAGTNSTTSFSLAVTPPEFVVSIVPRDLDDVPTFFSEQNGTAMPAVDTIGVGTRMVWKNLMDLDVYLSGGPPQYRITSVGDPSFPTSPGLSVYAEYGYTFTVPGTYRYNDPRYPATMQGTLVVR